MVDPCQILGKSDADTKQTVSNSTFIFEKSFYFVVTAAGTERLSNGRSFTDGYMLRSIASRIALGIDIQEVWIRYDDILRLIYKTEGQ